MAVQQVPQRLSQVARHILSSILLLILAWIYFSFDQLLNFTSVCLVIGRLEVRVKVTGLFLSQTTSTRFWHSTVHSFTFWLIFFTEEKTRTRMHSSRMRTGRSLTVCRSLLPGGGGRGCVCSGGDLLQGVSASGGCLLQGGVCSQGGGIPVYTEADPPC